MKKENIHLKYIVGDHPTIKNRIIMAFDDTGIDIKNPEHLHFIKVLAGSCAGMMFAHVQGIDPDNVSYEHQPEKG